MKLPKSWAEVTINTFHKCYAITKFYKDKTDTVSVTDRDIKIISALSGIPVTEIESWKATDFDEAKRQIAFIHGVPEETEIPIEFPLQGKNYKSQIFFEGLSTAQRRDISSLRLKAGQIIDYTTLVWDEETQDDSIYNMHNLLACVCVPEGDDGKYVYSGYINTAPVFLEHMPMSIAYPLYLFFSDVGKNSLGAIQTYFLKKSRKNLEKLKKELKELQRETVS